MAEFTFQTIIVRRVVSITVISLVLLSGIAALWIVYHWHVLGFITLAILCIAAAATALIITVRQLARHVTANLMMIVETSDALCNGVSQARVTITDAPLRFREMVQTFLAFNNLADHQNTNIQELKRLEGIRTEFLANVSHELRTPIFSIQGFLETLLDGALEDEDIARKFIEKAHSNTIRLNVLLTDLIDISRIESGALRFRFRYFSMYPMLEEILQQFEPVARQASVSLILQASDSDVQVYGDRDRLTQVVSNLVDNAIKYNQPQGSVTVAMNRINDGQSTGLVEVRITDTGIGIAPEFHKRIFERFFRVDKARSRAVGGTGLGLAIVKHIVEAHKSTLDIQSEPGTGTCIKFILKE